LHGRSKAQAPGHGRLTAHSDYLLSLFSVLVVVFVPSPCCVVVLSLDWPVDGFRADVLLLFCPSGFSVVVVLEVVWANPAPPKAKLSPMAIAAIIVFERMVFLLLSVWRLVVSRCCAHAGTAEATDERTRARPEAGG
jgi:hypothetical protein